MNKNYVSRGNISKKIIENKINLEKPKLRRWLI